MSAGIVLESFEGLGYLETLGNHLILDRTESIIQKDPYKKIARVLIRRRQRFRRSSAAGQ